MSGALPGGKVYEVNESDAKEAFMATENYEADTRSIDDTPVAEVMRYVRSEVIAGEQLPEKYRLVVYLYYSADMKLTEIAECLHLSVNTVKTRLRKAKLLLKEKLEVIGYER